MMKTVDIKGIDILPHRDPFLFLDRLVSHSPSESVGEVTFGEERDFFRGHFPGYPIVPGVILLEAMAQAAAAGVLVSQREGQVARTSDILLFAGADKVRFRRPVRPGDRLETHAGVLKIARGMAKFHVRGLVAGELAVEADIFCVARKEAE